ncbi:MAG: hemolysin III family protein [Alphaproteobacteria bacterium]
MRRRAVRVEGALSCPRARPYVRRIVTGLAPTFHSYTRAERLADAAVHVAGLTFGAVAGPWLVIAVADAGGRWATAAVVLYVLGLWGMLSASAAFNLAPAGRAKAILRRIDHAMILAMIAGSYTPFALVLMPRPLGLPLSITVWTLAAIGAAMAVLRPMWLQRWGLVLYLGAGWLLLPLLGPISEALPRPVLELLIAGGLVYSAGSVVHLLRRLRFHNAAWHAFVLVGAVLHWIAVYRAFAA